jgi:hypothetical protein
MVQVRAGVIRAHPRDGGNSQPGLDSVAHRPGSGAVPASLKAGSSQQQVGPGVPDLLDYQVGYFLEAFRRIIVPTYDGGNDFRFALKQLLQEPARANRPRMDFRRDIGPVLAADAAEELV